jgi:hypothetical protein
MTATKTTYLPSSTSRIATAEPRLQRWQRASSIGVSTLKDQFAQLRRCRRLRVVMGQRPTTAVLSDQAALAKSETGSPSRRTDCPLQDELRA